MTIRTNIALAEDVDATRPLGIGCYCRSANVNSDWPAATPMYCRPLTA